MDHYENFPVASLLLPRRLREPIRWVYRFARNADDFADEGDHLPAERLALLEAYRAQLQHIANGEVPNHPLFLALRDRVIVPYRLPLQPLHDLLDAFTQDVQKTRYADYATLDQYCRRSANPVGRIVLHLMFQQAALPKDRVQCSGLQANGTLPDQRLIAYSDAICTALQQINFWQDIALDWQKGRVYLPLEDCAHFGVTEADIAAARSDTPRWQALLHFEATRTRQLMHTGAPLARALPGRLGWEIRFVVLGGLAILDQLEAARWDMFRQRPTLSRRDWVRLIYAGLRYRW